MGKALSTLTTMQRSNDLLAASRKDQRAVTVTGEAKPGEVSPDTPLQFRFVRKRVGDTPGLALGALMFFSTLMDHITPPCSSLVPGGYNRYRSFSDDSRGLIGASDRTTGQLSVSSPALAAN
jgi:hypothetical protein